MMEMTSPVRTSFDIFHKEQIRENVSLLSHVPRENATYVHLPSGTVVTRARLGGVDESPNINKIRKSLFRTDPFDEERSPRKNAENKIAKKTGNDSGFSEKYRDNSFAYYNRMFMSDSSSDSESFDFSDDDDIAMRDNSDDDWVPMVQIQRKSAKLVERKTDSNKSKVIPRPLTKRKTVSETKENQSPHVKISRRTCNTKESPLVNEKDVEGETQAGPCASAKRETGTKLKSSPHVQIPRRLSARTAASVVNKQVNDIPKNPMNDEIEPKSSKNNATNVIEPKTKDVEMISATMKFADLVFQFHNNVKLKMESDCDDDMTDISEAETEELD